MTGDGLGATDDTWFCTDGMTDGVSVRIVNITNAANARSPSAPIIFLPRMSVFSPLLTSTA